MKIAVIGANYVGLVVATCLADTGHDVVAVDIDESRVERLRRSEPTIYEPGLAELLRRNSSEGRLTFTTKHAEAVDGALVVFLAVGTPPRDDGSVDLSWIETAADQVAEAATDYFVLAIKSTVPVGTADMVRDRMAKRTDHAFDVVSNPEFLKEGAALEDFQKPDRVVIGAADPRPAAIVRELYAPFVRTGKPILVMDNRSAELTKYAANALLASRISFMNDMANLAERLGANVDQVREGVGSDARIGYPFLFPGVGFGGSCFPKDLEAVAAMGREVGHPSRMVEAAIAINHDQKGVLGAKVERYFEGKLNDKTVAVWGLAFKPRTDDMRESPSVVLIQKLIDAGATVRAFDPVAHETARTIFGDRITYAESAYAAVEGAHALCLVTEWQEFRRPKFERIKESMAGGGTPAVFDGRNIWNGETLRSLGFDYFGIGMPSSKFPDEK